VIDDGIRLFIADGFSKNCFVRGKFALINGEREKNVISCLLC
jgi:hypothetical protein